MSKKNSNAILKSGFKNTSDLLKIYNNFKNKLKSLKNESYLIAISGGPDSLALAALSKAYSYESKIKFYYVLVDHRLRKQSKKEATQVKKLLKDKKINLNILENKKIIKKNIQSNARKIRYDLLAKYCLKKDIKTIITAHHLDDQVETFFIRLSRGSGLTGLSSMKFKSNLNKNIKLIRPLLDVSKKDLIKLTKKIYSRYLRDPSNKNKKYLRTRVRNLKKYLMNSGITYKQIIKSINNLASSQVTLDNYYKKTFREVVEKTKGGIILSFEEFKPLNNEIKIRLINDSIRHIKKNYYNPRSKKVENLIKNLMRKNFKQSTLGGCIFYLKKDKLCLKIEKKV